MSKNFLKVIVIGAGGFIGSHMVDRLVTLGCHVVAIDKFSEGIEQHQVSPTHRKYVEFYKADITDPSISLKKYFHNAEWVFHFIGKSGNIPSLEQPSLYHAINVTGTLNVLEAARDSGVKRFLYPASSSCYGSPDIYPTPETAPIQLNSPYSLSKFLGESYVLHWGKVYHLPVVSLRLFNVYGPKIRKYGSYGPIITKFINQKMSGIPCTVVGDGKQTRDFTYITDVIDAFIQAAESSICGEVFNVGSGQPHSIHEAVKLLGTNHVHIPKGPVEISRMYADIKKIRKYLGWKPKVTFSHGIENVLRSIV